MVRCHQPAWGKVGDFCRIQENPVGEVWEQEGEVSLWSVFGNASSDSSTSLKEDNEESEAEG